MSEGLTIILLPAGTNTGSVRINGKPVRYEGHPMSYDELCAADTLLTFEPIHAPSGEVDFYLGKRAEGPPGVIIWERCDRLHRGIVMPLVEMEEASPRSRNFYNDMIRGRQKPLRPHRG